MVESGAVAYQTATCELDASRHDLITEAACALLLRWDGEEAQAAQFGQMVANELAAELLTYQEEKKRRNWR